MSARARLAAIVSGLAAVLLSLMALALFVGSAGVPPAAVVGALRGRPDAEAVARVVVPDLRLPRTLAATPLPLWWSWPTRRRPICCRPGRGLLIRKSLRS